MSGAANGTGTPYVGRSGLRSALERALEACCTGTGGLVLLRGEAGIGKSATLDWLEERASERGVVFLRGRCAEVQGAPAYLPWSEVLTALLRCPDAPAPAHGGPLLALLAGSNDDTVPSREETAPFRLFREVTDVLVQAARRAPLLIGIDDLHAGDAGSVRLLAFAARELAGIPLLVVATARGGNSEPVAEPLSDLGRRATTLELEGLSAEEVAVLAGSLAGREVPAALAAALRERSRGNPLFLRQLVGVLLAEGADLDASEAVARAGALAPEGVRHAIRERLRRLPETVRRALGLAAACGRRFEVDLVREAWAALEAGREFPGLDEAIRGGVVQRTDRLEELAFPHELFRDELHSALTAELRRGAHTALAEAIAKFRDVEDTTWLTALAHHALAAEGKIPWHRGAEWAGRAGERALARHALEEALGWFDRGLAALARSEWPGQRDGLRARLLLGRGTARWRGGDSQAAREDFVAATELGRSLANAELLAEAALGFAGRTDATLGPETEATALLEEAAEQLGPEPSRLRADVLTRLATSLYFSEDADRSERVSLDAVTCAEALDDSSALAYALTGRHYTLYRPGRLLERRAVAARTLDLAGRADDENTRSMAHFHAILNALEAGDFAEWDRHLGAYGVIAERLRQPYHLWQHRALRTTRALAAGRLTEAEGLAGEALELGQRAGSPNALPLFSSHLFALRREQGRLAELEPLLFRLGEALPSMPAFDFARAELDLASGRSEEARAFLRAVAAQGFSDLSDDFNWPALASIAARLCIALDDPLAATSLYDRMRDADGGCIVLGIGNVWDGAVAWYLGSLATVTGELDRAAVHLADAEALHARVGARVWLAHTWRAQAELLRRRGEADEAGALLHRSVALERDLGVGVAPEAGAVASPAPAEPDAATCGEEAERWARTPQGDRWTVRFDGREAALPDARGFTYLAELLARPGEPIHVLDLLARIAPEGELPKSTSGGMDLLDERARTEYRQRLEELREEIEEAEAWADTGRAERARAELEAVQEALASALGLGGRTRRAGDPVERARKAVYNRIRDAIRRVESEIPELAAHLRNSVHTGRVCIYRPERPVRWLARP